MRSKPFDSGKIEAQAMEYMRGRSIRDRYMIIDEAQNMTPLQAFGIISPRRCRHQNHSDRRSESGR